MRGLFLSKTSDDHLTDIRQTQAGKPVRRSYRQNIPKVRVIPFDAAGTIDIVKTVQNSVVLVMPESASMKVVCARLCNNIEDRSLISAVSSVEVVCYDLVFLN